VADADAEQEASGRVLVETVVRRRDRPRVVLLDVDDAGGDDEVIGGVEQALDHLEPSVR
jgi:hypothetical protein